MKRRKRNILLKRIVALIMAVTMLPFADYGQVFAYSGQNNITEQNETVNTESAVKEMDDSAEFLTEEQENQVQDNGDPKDVQQQSETESVSENSYQKPSEASQVGEASEPELLLESEDVLQIDTLSLTSDYVMEQDMEVNHLDLNGYHLTGYYSLTVHGDVKLDNGSIELWDSFTIEGNLDIPEESTVKIDIYSLTSQINVKGNLRFLGTGDFTGFHRVSMNVEGDVEIGETVIENDYISKLNLCGKNKQTVTVPESLTIGTLEVNNTSEEGIYSEKPIKRHRSHVNTGNITYKDMKGIQGYTLTEDTVIEGDIILGDGCLNLNGYQLIIAGDFIQESGEVNINGGNLIVEGDYRIQTKNEIDGQITYGPSYGCLYMVNSEDYVLVKGDFYTHALTMFDDHVYDYYDEVIQHLGAGVLELKGDFIQEALEKEEVEVRWGSGTTLELVAPFGMRGIHETIFSGEKQQRILGAENISFNYLEIRNTSSMGIYSDIYSEKIDKARKEDENGNKCLYSYVLDGYDYLQGGVLKEDLNVTGDLVLSDGELDLAGHTLTVSGNFIQKGGTVSVNKGKLIVNKDYRMQDYRIIENETSEENTSDGDDTVSENTTGGNNEDAKGETEEEKQIEYSSSYGILQMSEEADYVQVKGNFYAQSMATQKDSLTAGTLEVQGDFTQSGNFYATENHKVALTGNKLQKIIYDTSESMYITNRIHHLNIENKSPEGVIFENNPTVSGTLNEGDSKISGGISICSTTEFTKEIFPGNVTILEDFVLDKNMTFEGSLTALGKLTVEKTATVKKDVTVKELSMTGGRLNCGQNFEAKSLQMKQAEDYIFIEKNATIQKGTATEGTIEVKGNVTFTGDFDAGGNHKFIFSGNEKQEYTETQIKGYLSISHHAALQNVEFQNYSEEGIVAEYGMLIKGELTHNNCNYTVGGKKGTFGYALEKDTVLTDDLCLVGGVMDLNGHTLTVEGDILHMGGDIILNGGTLHVKGDYRSQVYAKEEYVEGTGRLIMKNQNDKVLIEKDAYLWCDNENYKGNLSAGDLEIKGDFSLSGYTDFTGDIKVVFSGDEKQTIITEDYGYPRFVHLDLQNTSKEGIVSGRIIYASGKITGNGENVTIPELVINNLNNLECDTYGGNVTVEEDTDLTHNVSIDGLLVLKKQLNLDKYEITCENLSVKGNLVIGEGTVYCKEDCTIESTGALHMLWENGYFLVGGNFTTKSRQDHADKLLAGTLEVRGDFTQSSYNSKNFIASGTHTTILGRKKLEDGSTYVSTISFGNPGSSKFNKLILTKDYENGYVFKNSLDVIANEVIYQIEDDEAPSPVTEIKASEIKESEITITYSGATDNTGIKGYEIYRNGKKIAVISEEEFHDKGLESNTEYTYEVYPFDSYRNKTTTSPALEVTTKADTEAPSTVTELEVKERTGSSITIRWYGAKDNVGVTGYDIYRNGDKIAEGVTETTYKDTGLKVNKGYTYQIVAYDKAGNYSPLSQELDTCVAMPKIVSITPADNEAIGGAYTCFEVVFENVGNNKNNQVLISYYDENSQEWIQAGKGTIVEPRFHVTATYTFDNSKLSETGEYKFAITVRDEDGNETTEINTYYLDKTPPKAVEGLKAEEADGVVTLTWETSPNQDCAEYLLYRLQEETGICERIAVVSGRNNVSYMDKEAENGFYSYWIQATDNFGNKSSLSEEVTVEVAKDTVSPCIEEIYPIQEKISAKSQIQVVAKDNKAVDSIRLECRKEDEEQWSLVDEIKAEDGKAVFYLKEGLIESGYCYLRAVAKDASGNESEEKISDKYLVDNQGISKPELTNALATSTTVRLLWNHIEEEDFDYVLIEQINGGDFNEQVAKAHCRYGYDIKNLNPGRTYTFCITGYDELGNKGETSDSITITTMADTTAPVICGANCTIDKDKPNCLNMRVKIQDDFGVNSVVFSYSYDSENYTEIARTSSVKREQEETLEATLDFTELPEGEVTIKIEAYDTAGNASYIIEDGIQKPFTMKYTIDHQPPGIVENVQIASSEGAITLTWDANIETDVTSYRIYRALESDGIFKIVGRVSAKTDFVDTNAKVNTSYMYKIAAVDAAGNEGECSKTVVGMTEPDTVVPEILGVSPQDESILGIEPDIKIVVKDNSEIATIKAEYQKVDATDAIWYEIDTIEKVNCNLIRFEPEWDTSGLTEGVYRIRVSATDTSGNVSEYVTRNYTLDLTAPEKPQLTTETQNFAVGIEYSENEEEDFAYYEIYRKEVGDEKYQYINQTTECSYTDSDIKPGTLYFYQVKSYDKQGNSTLSKGISGYADDTDIVAPTAVLGEGLTGVVGYELVFDGTASTDNVGIKKYSWNMGDGTKLSGATVRHAYSKAGSYTVTLTVTDAAGNKGSASCVVIINDKAGTGTTKLQVKDKNGLGIPHAYVAVKKGEDDYFRAQTDKNGWLDISDEAGSYEVEAYAQGYAPASTNIRISEVETLYADITLQNSEMIIGELEVKKLELEELVTKGVDLSNEDNYHRFSIKVSVTLKETKQMYTDIYEDVIIRKPSDDDNKKPPREHDFGDCKMSYDISVDENEKPTLVYVTTRQSISWLKDMYEITLGITNIAGSSYTINNAVAQLKLPDGVSLAATTHSQSLEQKMEDIPGLRTKTVSWIVKGDKEGEYEAEVDFNGNLSPINAPISATFKTTNKFEVMTGEGIHIYVMPEETAYVGEYYYIQFRIENQSSRNFYNFKTSLGTYIEPADKHVVVVHKTSGGGSIKEYTSGADYYSTSATKCSELPVLYNGDTVTLGVFQPGEILYGTYRTKVKDEGPINTYYYKLVKSVVEVLEGSNLGVEVHIDSIDSHMTKSAYTRHVKNKKPTSKSPNNPSTEPTGDPVDTITGAFIDNINVLSVAGATTVALDLSYSSLLTDEKGEFGYGWSHSYETKIVQEGGIARLYTTPSNYASFLPETAISRALNGEILQDRIHLDESTEYYGKYIPISGELEGMYIERKEDKTYEFHTTENEVYTFNEKGQLTNIKDKDSKEVVISHKEKETVIKEKASGRKITFSYNDDGLIEKAQDSAGREATFRYSAEKRLEQIVFPDETKRVFTYDDKGKLKSETSIEVDGKQNTFVTNEYDKEGRVTSQKEAISDAPTIFEYEDWGDCGTKNTITDHNGNTMTVIADADGNMLESVNAKGSKTSYTYDKYGNVLIQTDHKGNKITNSYDEDGNLTSTEDAAGKITSYGYDGSGNLTSISDSAKRQASFTYNANNQMTLMFNALGGKTTYTYGDYGLLTEECVEGKGTKKYTYKKGMLASVTDFNGNVTKYTYDDAGNVKIITEGAGTQEARKTEYTYDAMNRVETVTTGKSGTVTYCYDANGNKTSYIDALGNETKYTYNKAGKLKKVVNAKGQTTSYSYDEMGNLKQVKYCDDTEENYTYDEVGNMLTHEKRDGTTYYYKYDMLNNKTEEGILFDGEPRKGSENARVLYDYYPNGKIYKETYPDGQTTTYTYNDCWQLSLVTDKEENSTRYERDAAGNVRTETKPLNTISKYTYDEYGRMLSYTDPNGNTTTYEYDGNGNCIKTVNPMKVETEFRYNALNQLTTIIVHTKNQGDYQRSYEYNGLGLVTAIIDEEGNRKEAEYDNNGNLKVVRDAKEQIIEDNEYNALNQLVSSKDALENITNYQYNKSGFVAYVTRCYNTPNAVTTGYDYDGEGKLTEVTDAEEGLSLYNYNEYGNIISIQDPKEGITGYEYNNMGKVITETSPLGNTIDYKYNSLGLLSERTEGRYTTKYKYDALGRITSQKDSLGAISYTYDANGNVKTVTDKSGTITRNYDALNRVTACTDHKGNTVQYGYDELGNRISVTYPGGEIIRYEYYKNGWLKSVTDNKNRKTEYIYDKNGRLTTTKNANGTTEERSYDLAGQLTDIKVSKGFSVLSSCHYEYDGRGNIITETNSGGDGTKDLSSLTTIAMEYDEENRLTKYNGREVSYDGNGNMTYGPLNGVMTDFAYDCRNRLIRAGETEYEYDAENNRTAKIENGIREDYVLDRESSLVQILKTKYSKKNALGLYTSAGDGTIYVYGAGLISQDSDAVATELNGPNVTDAPDYLQYHYNNLGSTIMVTDSMGAVKARFQYGTYGELLSANNLCLKFLYNGKYGVATDENGLYYMRARYYNVSIKRFINRDVITGDLSNPQSLNRYSYVQGNPVNLLDPFGLSPSSDDGGGGDGNEQSFWGKWGHTILDVAGFFPGIGDVADVVNAAWYFAEGDNLMGSLSLVSALPVVGSFLGNGAKVVAKTTKVASKGGKVVNRVNKAADVVKNGTKLVSHSTDLTTTAIDISYGVSDLHQEIKSGNINWKTAGGLALNIGLALVAGHGSIKSGNGLRKALNNSGSGTVTAHTSSSIKNTGSPEVSDNKARVQAQVGGESGLSSGNMYAGVREASEYLKQQGVSRKYRKQILESFDVRTIKLQKAGKNTYGLRFYGGGAERKGRYLFETFSPLTNRNNLALPNEWNNMTKIQQFQVKEGTTMITGNAAPQTSYGSQYVGGAYQWYINNLEDLIQ